MRKSVFIILSFIFLACNSNDKSIQNFGLESDNVDLSDCTGNDYHIQLENKDPLGFLRSLIKRDNDFNEICPRNFLVVCDPIDKTWITKRDVGLLIPYLDSNYRVTVPTFSLLASITLTDHGNSTLARESYHLINLYRNGGVYPPYCSIPLGGAVGDVYKLEDSLKTEIKEWWKTENLK